MALMAINKNAHLYGEKMEGKYTIFTLLIYIAFLFFKQSPLLWANNGPVFSVRDYNPLDRWLLCSTVRQTFGDYAYGLTDVPVFFFFLSGRCWTAYFHHTNFEHIMNLAHPRATFPDAL